MDVEMRNIGDVKPYEGNPRQNEQAVDAVAASIREFGFRQPLVVDEDGVIVAGHTRYQAALKLGLTQVPVHVAKGLSPEQVRAYRLADNATRDLSEWDYELLPIELGELKDAGYDLELIGFPEDELAEIMDTGELKEGLTDPDQVPEPPDEPTTRPGDLWILGDHRLLCGDAGKAEDVDRLLGGETIDLLNTDPPYGVCVEPRSSTAIAAGQSRYPDLSRKMHHQQMDMAHGVTDPKRARKKMRPKDRPLEGDFLPRDEYRKLLRAWFGQAARVLKAGGAFYIWGGYESGPANYPPAFEECGFYFSQTIIWVKQPVLTRKDFLGAHEMCFYGWRQGAGHKFYGPNNMRDVWDVKKVSQQKMVHLTEKPVELAVRAIQCSSRPGENVLDLFGGSGSTLIACEQTGRRCYMMEIDALYCDVIVQRWEEFTGQKAERIEGHERTPADVAGVKEDD